MRPTPADSKSIARAVELLRSGGVVAFPTETLYGLGCSAANRNAVERIFRIKGRGEDKPLPLVVADERAAQALAILAPAARPLTARFWPGPLTLILKSRRDLPAGVAPEGKLAIRVSPHPVASALAKGLGGALVATSANKTGAPPPVTADEAAAALAHDPPDMILDGGPSPGGPPSTILDLTGPEPKLLRAGAIDPDELEDCLAVS